MSAPPRIDAMRAILAAVANIYGISVNDLHGRSRTKGIAEARALACYLAKRCTILSYPEIGSVLGRHHTTIMALVDSAGRIARKDARFAEVLSGLSGQLMRENTR